MKIGITCYPTYGGSGAVATELGIRLAQRGHEVHFIAYALPFRLSTFQERLFFHQVQVSTYPLFDFPPYDITLAAKMVDVAEEVGLDILHVHYAIPHAISAHLAQEVLGGRVRVVTTLHGTDITLVGADPSLRSITRFAIESSDVVTCVSSYLQRQTQATFRLRKPIRVILNFIDTARFTPRSNAEMRRHYAPAGESVLIHLSNFRPVKRVTDVLQIFAQVAQTLPARLLMVGDGVDRPAAQERCRQLGLEKLVFFFGRQEDVPSLLNLADLFLLPSENESFGLAALEAMSCGVPVITTRVGGLPEVVEDTVTGFLHSVGDVTGMSEAALELLTHPDRHRAMARAARKRAIQAFDASQIVPIYEDLYRALLGG
ncbi:MAG: N-acetyl-alpha-D-glucosaminyl L-malate synthase BshA [Candidatus Methylomirabilales bacterium]